MAMGAAWKLRRVVENVRHVLAIELMCAAQGLDYRAPLRAGRGAARGQALVRELVAPLDADRVLAGDIARLADAIERGHFTPAVRERPREHRRSPGPRPVRAPRGTELSCKGWQQEAALRMLMNNLDPEVAERPDDLVVYGGTGTRRAQLGGVRRDRRTRCAHSRTTRRCSCRAASPSRCSARIASAPRVLIANSNLVGRWATWDHFRELERRGLMMYGQMTAGSWIYIGSQGIVQGTYETFGAVARRHFGGSLAGRLVVTAGLGGMGGAQPLAATMQGAALLGFDVDESRIDKRIATGYCDVKAATLDEGLALADAARARGTCAVRRRRR